MSGGEQRFRRVRALWEGVIQNPLRFRAALGASFFLAWYFALYQPAVTAIQETRATLDAQRKQLDTAVQIDRLRGQVARFRKGQPERTDQNELVQYLVAGVRQRPVKLVNLEPRGTIELGPYRIQQVSIVIEGDYASLVALLHWIESDSRLFRIESLRMEVERTKAKARDGVSLPCKLDLGILGILS
jgi:type II secretory pathway component PulM